MVGSLKARVSASLNTSLTSLVLVSWFGAVPKRWFNEAPTLVLFAAVILVVVKPI